MAFLGPGMLAIAHMGALMAVILGWLKRDKDTSVPRLVFMLTLMSAVEAICIGLICDSAIAISASEVARGFAVLGAILGLLLLLAVMPFLAGLYVECKGRSMAASQRPPALVYSIEKTTISCVRYFPRFFSRLMLAGGWKYVGSRRRIGIAITVGTGLAGLAAISSVEVDSILGRDMGHDVSWVARSLALVAGSYLNWWAFLAITLIASILSIIILFLLIFKKFRYSVSLDDYLEVIENVYHPLWAFVGLGLMTIYIMDRLLRVTLLLERLYPRVGTPSWALGAFITIAAPLTLALLAWRDVKGYLNTSSNPRLYTVRSELLYATALYKAARWLTAGLVLMIAFSSLGLLDSMNTPLIRVVTLIAILLPLILYVVGALGIFMAPSMVREWLCLICSERGACGEAKGGWACPLASWGLIQPLFLRGEEHTQGGIPTGTYLCTRLGGGGGVPGRLGSGGDSRGEAAGSPEHKVNSVLVRLTLWALRVPLILASVSGLAAAAAVYTGFTMGLSESLVPLSGVMTALLVPLSIAAQIRGKVVGFTYIDLDALFRFSLVCMDTMYAASKEAGSRGGTSADPYRRLTDEQLRGLCRPYCPAGHPVRRAKNIY